MKQILSINPFLRVKSATHLASLVMATLLLAACSSGGGGGGAAASGPALATGLNSDKDGIVLTWSNPAGVRNITITRIDYLRADAVGIPQPPVTHNNVTGDSALIAAGRITLDITGTTPNRYYSFNIARVYESGRTDTLVSARQYLPPPTGPVVVDLTADKTGVTLSWTNPQNVAGITSIRIIRNEFADATASVPLNTITTTTTDAAAITSSATGTLDITGLTIGRFYTFTVTPIYTGNIEGQGSVISNRQYIPLAIDSAVTATLGAGNLSVSISWENPANAAGIIAVRITRNEFADESTDVFTTTIDTPDFTEATATADSTATAIAATLKLTAGFTSGSYYTFAIAPVYTGNVIGLASAPSARVGPLSLPTNFDTVTALRGTDTGSVTLDFNNPVGVESITVNGQVFDTAISNTSIMDLAPTSYRENVNILPGAASVTITGLAANQYYRFNITRTFMPGAGDPITSDFSNRIYLPPTATITNVMTTLNSDQTKIVIKWLNPINAAGITAIKTSIRGYDVATGGQFVGVLPTAITSTAAAIASSNAAATAATLDIANRLPNDFYWEFTLTPIYTGNIEGIATPAIRQYLTPTTTITNVVATVSANSSIVELSWTNPNNRAGIIAINITSQGYDAATGGNLAGDPVSVVYPLESNTMLGPPLSIGRNGIEAGKHYEFTVAPIYNGNTQGFASLPTAPLVELLNMNRDLDAYADDQDVDTDGNGLIELYNVNDLNIMRNDLAGASLDGNDDGCGGGFDSGGNLIEECSGYELMAHVDLNDLPYVNGSNWEPIGFCSSSSTGSCASNAFSGDFNGNNHNISNMRINITTSNYGVGFFGSVRNSELRNLVLKNINISTDHSGLISFVGGLVGYGRNIDIIHSAAELNRLMTRFSAANNLFRTKFGGLVGDCFTCNIISSAVIADEIIGGLAMGGLAGTLTGDIISSLAIVRNIDADAFYSGGLLGESTDADLIFSTAITNSVVAGDLNLGGNFAGGLIGEASTLESISSSYAISAEIISFESAGGILGGGNNIDGIESSYYNVETFTLGVVNGTQNTPNTYGTSLTIDQLQPSSFSSTGDADFTSWGQGWCDKTTGEFTQEPTSALALSNGGANYAWDIGADKFPVPACTPFSPDTLRTAIGKVRNDENPVPIN